MDSRKERRRKKRKWPKRLASILVILILIVGGYVYYMWDKISDTFEAMHNPLARDENPERQKELEALFKNKQAVNILLLGVDQRKGDKGRSDTMILLSLNPKNNSMIMMSIPRDTYVNIPGRGMDKINHAYAFGDVGLSIDTVEETFNIPVHFYARVNMEGFKQGIDAIGGVTITNNQAFAQGGRSFPQGQIHLNGNDALKYIRMRKNDPRGDLGRNERQRSVITAAMNKAASFSNITKFDDILHIMGNNVQTDLNIERVQALFNGYRDTIKNNKSLEINGNGQMISGVWYYLVPESEFKRISTELNNHMNAN